MGLLCAASQGANSFMFVHTMDTTGIYHTTVCVFLVPCWCVLMTEKLIKSGTWCCHWLRERNSPRFGGPWADGICPARFPIPLTARAHPWISTSCSPDSHYPHVYPPPPLLSFPPFPSPSISGHSSSYTCLPQLLLKQHSAAVVLMMVEEGRAR